MSLKINSLRMMKAGPPGSHLGVAHLVKHYLNPGEYWDDLAEVALPASSESVADATEFWPASIAARLTARGAGAVHRQNPAAPAPAVVDAWEMLADATTRGYGAVVEAAFSGALGEIGGFGDISSRSLSAPGGIERQAVSVAGGRVALLLPGGIIVVGDAVAAPSNSAASNGAEPPRTGTVLHMRTAYRPTLTPTARFGQGPRDAANRAIRRGLSELKAAARLLALTAGDHDE